MKKLIKLLLLMLLPGVVFNIQAMVELRNTVGDVGLSTLSGDVSLHRAAEKGLLDFAVTLVNTGADLYKKDYLDRDACAVAIGAGYFDIAYYLTDVKDFYKACEDGDKKKVMEIVTKSKPQVPISLGLHRLKYGDYRGVADYLFENGASIHVQDGQGHTPLHWAVYNRCFDLVDYFVKKGSDVNVDDIDGYTPLHIAVTNDDYDWCRYNPKETSLFVKDDCVNIVDCLLKHGANINQYTKNGDTALHIAAAGGCFKIITCLLKNGADVHMLNRECRPAILSAIGSKIVFAFSEEKLCKVVQLLIEHGADIKKLYKNRWTALRYAVHNKCPDLVELLLKSGVSVNDKDPISGDTALHYAVSTDHENEEDLIDILLAYGARADLTNNAGKTSRDVVTARRQEEDGDEDAIIDHLELVEDFYRVIESKMTFQDFAEKYFANKKNVIWTGKILHLGDKNLADKFYEWTSKSKLCQEKKLCFKEKIDMYLKLCNQSTTSEKKELWFGLAQDMAPDMPKASLYLRLFNQSTTSEKKELWFGLAKDTEPQDMSKESVKVRKDLKRKLDIDDPKSGPLRKKFCSLSYLLSQQVPQQVKPGLTPKPGIPVDMKIKFKK